MINLKKIDHHKIIEYVKDFEKEKDMGEDIDAKNQITQSPDIHPSTSLDNTSISQSETNIIHNYRMHITEKSSDDKETELPEEEPTLNLPDYQDYVGQIIKWKSSTSRYDFHYCQ